MKRLASGALLCALTFWFMSGWTAVGAVQETVSVCPASSVSKTPPSFAASDCASTNMNQVDPQRRLIWVKAGVVASEGDPAVPLALQDQENSRPCFS